jgi:molybdate transport system substrate-binding protein
MATLKLLSSMAPKACLAAAIELYGKSHTDRVLAEAAGGVDVTQRIAAGEAVDLVVLSDDAIEKLQAGGHVARDGRMPLMSSGIAVAVKTGAASPTISNEAAVKAAVLGSASISYSTGPSGRYLESLFTRWGILESIRERVVVPPPGTPVAELVASGEADLGFQQLSEMLNAPGIRVLGPLPDDIQQETIFSGAVTSVSTMKESARDLLRFLASPALGTIRLQFGMSAVDRREALSNPYEIATKTIT